MDEEEKQKMVKEILDQIDEILYKEERDVENDINAITALLDKAKEKGLI